MYEITEDSSLAHFKSKLLNLRSSELDNHSRKRYWYSNVNCIGYGHKTLNFKIDGDGSIDIVYKNKINGESFKITTHFARLSYSIRLDKSNINYSYFRSHPENEENIMTRKNINVIGITVGDFLKHFYHTNKDKKTIEFSDDENENEKMLKLVKKSLSIETANAKVTNVLGKYQFKRKTVRLWENLIREKFIDKGESDFTGFCNKMLILSESMFYNICTRDPNNEITFNDKYYRNFFNNLSDKKVVSKLLRYHLYNEDPEDGLHTQTFYFEKPALVPDILKYFHEKYNDNSYMVEYNNVMKNLNAGQAQDLEKRYSPAVFKSIQNVSDEYPIYAFRNIYLEQWKSGDLWDLSGHHDDYMQSVKNQKYKHKSTNSDKVIPVEKRFYYNYYKNYFPDRKITKYDIQNLISEGLNDFEHDLESGSDSD